MTRIIIALCVCIGAVSFSFGQFPEAYSSSRLYHDLQKANGLASVLYIAAHPDDENTRLISYFENKLMARTAYLSLTRGDGGQNLVGTEIGAAIGVLRTEELLAARRIDGGEQYFSRAVDFGYSKSSVETLDKWGKDEVLADMVWVIRSFRPDAMVTRFPPNNYAGHGHHEASALLAEEAFTAAADPNRYPEQLQYVAPWQAKRLYFNTSSWWIKDLPEKARDNDNFLRVNVGEYDALLGETYARIAARSRSQHKSQGFGTDVYYGLNIEYMEYVLGDKADQEAGILDGVQTDWARIDAADVGALLAEAIAAYDFESPHRSVPIVLKARKLLLSKPASPLRDYKVSELQELALKLAGVYAEAIADDYYYAPGTAASLKLHLQHQYAAGLTLVEYGHGQMKPLREEIGFGQLFTANYTMDIPSDAKPSNHFWLRKPHGALFDVPEQRDRGRAANKPALMVTMRLSLEGEQLDVELPVLHKMVDPVKAVIYRPVHIMPPLTFRFEREVLVIVNGKKLEIKLKVMPHADAFRGSLSLDLPKGWSSIPASIEYRDGQKGNEEQFTFELSATANAESGMVRVQFKPEGAKSPWEEPWQLGEISYDHIPTQPYMTPAEIPLRKFEFDKGAVQRIGYFEGPGDEVAAYLKMVGYDVDIVSAEQIQSGLHHQYDAIVTGIRAYNTREELRYLQAQLNAYVHQGGTLLVQYNTSRGLKTEQLGPYPYTLGRERVTDEEATPHLLYPEHPAFHTPNVIAATDFEGWVQERGLYFASEWDEAFTPLIGWSDPGEPERQGGLIVAPYGKGYYVYSGISFFRQLPAGVPGAYRLLSNLLHLHDNGKAKP